MTNAIPNNWQNDEVLDGLDILDKQQLIGTPFRILGCVFQSNNDGISICYIDAERADGYTFTFLDASTGVRAQIVSYLTGKGLDAGLDTGEYIDFKLVVPNGLRVSEYEVPQKGPNGQQIGTRTRMARTYYLTTNGQRGAAGKASSKPAAQKRTTAAK